MNKNIVLLGLGAIALVLVSGLFLFSPQKEQLSYSYNDAQKNEKKEFNSLNVHYHSQHTQNNTTKTLQKKKQSKIQEEKRIRRLIAVSNHNRYIIEVIGDNLTEKDFQASSVTKLQGTIDGTYFILNIPDSILNKNIKLKITNHDTNESMPTISLSPYIEDMKSLSKNENIKLNINLQGSLPPAVDADIVEQQYVLPAGPH